MVGPPSGRCQEHNSPVVAGGERLSSQDNKSANTPREHITTFSGLLIRLFWMIGGNGILFFLTIAIFMESRGTLSGLDLAYWLVVVLQIAIRFYDIKYLGGATADYCTATLQDWTRYSVILFVAALSVWTVVHLIS